MKLSTSCGFDHKLKDLYPESIIGMYVRFLEHAAVTVDTDGIGSIRGRKDGAVHHTKLSANRTNGSRDTPQLLRSVAMGWAGSCWAAHIVPLTESDQMKRYQNGKENNLSSGCFRTAFSVATRANCFIIGTNNIFPGAETCYFRYLN